MTHRAAGLAVRVYALLLAAFPRRYRRRYGDEMVDAFRRELAARARQRGPWAAVGYCLAAWGDALASGLGARRGGSGAGGSPTGAAPGGPGRPAIGPRRGLGGPAGLVRDVVHAARSLARSPTYSVVCVLSLAVGLGGVVTVVLFIQALWATPAGVDGDSLVELVARPTGPARAEMAGPTDRWSYPDAVALREAGMGMRVTAWSAGDAVVAVDGEEASAAVDALYVTADYLGTVGVTPVRGRDFAPGEGEVGDPPVVIVGWDLWQNRLGGDADVVGGSLRVNRVEHTVVGIAPPGFHGTRTREGGRPAHLWLPLHEHPTVTASEAVLQDPETTWVHLLARTPRGMGPERADAAVATVVARLAAESPATHADLAGGAIPYSGIPALMRFEMTLVQGILLSASGLVLLVVCLNVAGMVVVRSASRRRELAVRLALGSGRAALVRYLLAEALVLSAASGTVAVVGVLGAIRGVAWRVGRPVPDALRPDPGLLGVCVALALLTTLTVGLWPALGFSRPDLFSALRDEVGGGGRRAGRIQKVAAAAQAGLALPFLVMGVIYLDHARSQVWELGFEPAGLYGVPLEPSAAGYGREEADALLRRLGDELAGVEGVRAVALGGGLPLDFQGRPVRVAREEDPTRFWAQSTRVAPGYLAAVGTPVIQGRDVAPEDVEGTEPVVVVTRALADRLEAARPVLGARVRFALRGLPERTYTVVGVAADVAGGQLGDSRRGVFVSLAQHPGDPLWVVVRSDADEASVTSALQATVTTLDPHLPRPAVTTGEALVDRSTRDFLAGFMVSGMLGVVALLLAALGIYGVVAFAVTRRTREFGVRMAMGASRRVVLEDVFRHAVRLALPGVAGGLVVVALFIRLKTDLPPTTPSALAVAFTAAAVLAVAFVVLASVGPALRASRVSPVEAIRTE